MVDMTFAGIAIAESRVLGTRRQEVHWDVPLRCVSTPSHSHWLVSFPLALCSQGAPRHSCPQLACFCPVRAGPTGSLPDATTSRFRGDRAAAETLGLRASGVLMAEEEEPGRGVGAKLAGPPGPDPPDPRMGRAVPAGPPDLGWGRAGLPFPRPGWGRGRPGRLVQPDLGVQSAVPCALLTGRGGRMWPPSATVA